MTPEAIIKELRAFQAQAAEANRWATTLIEKLEQGEVKKKGKGVTAADIARVRANRRKTILKRQQKNA